MFQTLTVNLPGELYGRIKERAEASRRSVEDETIELLATTVPTSGQLSVELQQSLASLEYLDDADVERAARSRLPAELADELEHLHHKQQREGLTAPEDARREELIRAYEKSMLIRAQAAALLKRRGLNVSDLVAIR